MDLKDGRLGASRRGLGREFQVTGPMYQKAHFPYLLNLMRGTVYHSVVRGDSLTPDHSTERSLQNAESGKIDRQREDEISKQEQMNLCYDSTW